IQNLKTQSDTYHKNWKQEKAHLDQIRLIKEQIEQQKLEEEQAERAGNLEKVSSIRYGSLLDLQKQIDSLNKDALDHRIIREEINEEDIAVIVSQWTGIPVSKMMEGEREKLIKLEENLLKRVVGQDKALRSVSDAIRRARAGIQDPNRPIGSFMFLGPTGVGKTELAKALAEYLFSDENALIRVDMSEYLEKHTVARLIGAPPGYVGYEQGGYLTEKVRRKPYSVVLLDEIEKAHPDVFNIMLQVLDDGRLTDGQGRTVDFKNTIVIMSSNAGSTWIQELGEKDYDEMVRRVEEEIKKLFRPEFLNRIDDIIIFNALSQDVVEKITRIQLDLLRKRLKDQDIDLEVSNGVVAWLGRTGYDPSFGARPLKRLIQQSILNPLSLQILQGKFKNNNHILVNMGKNKDLIFDASVIKQV
ncbi:MAG: AAA family ATPase, partial [Chlamydiota bacterium]|nr:AAA family ATPase [Chlamydiota bacterium]